MSEEMYLDVDIEHGAEDMAQHAGRMEKG